MNEHYRQTICEAFRFALVGVLATGIHYWLYWFFLYVIPANPAYALGYLLSFILNFYATSYFTFHSSPTWSKLVGMAGAHGVNFLLHMCLLNVFLGMNVPDRWVPLPVYCVAIPVNFILVRFVFKKKNKKR